MSLPLEVINPEKYGLFDRDQIELIMEYDAYDLVLIENATELFRQVMHEKPGNLEAMLKRIVDETQTECIYLLSETFPYYLKPATLRDFPNTTGNEHASKSAYDSAVRRYKRDNLTKKVKSKKCIVGLFAANLLDAGGHYAAYIWNNPSKKLVIFDSMSTSYVPSVYYPYFQQLGRDLFGVPNEIAVPCVKGLISLQHTGGFPGHVPYVASIILQQKIDQAMQYDDISEATRLEEKLIRISLQSTESQNHFCYMWSIWFINALVAGYSLEDLTETIRDNSLDPLFVIKRYAWSMLKLTGLEKQLEHPELYEEFFPRVWHAIEGADSDDFRMYGLDIPVCESANKCLEESIAPVRLRELPPTIPPEEVTAFIYDQLN